MYPDTKRIRDIRLTLRLDTYEDRLVKALADYKGEQLATMVRAMAVKEALRVLDLDQSFADRVA